MNLNLKPYLYRTLWNATYIIPVDMGEKFDKLWDLLDEVDADDYVAQQLLFAQLREFEQYEMGGEIRTIVMWINPDDLA